MNLLKSISSLSLLTLVLTLTLACSKKTPQELDQPKNTLQQSGKGIIYPHSENWAASGAHGAAFLKNSESCKSCHGNDLNGGTSKISCASCHTNYPHSADFKATATHGKKYYADRLNCTSCHGRDYTGGSTGISCTKCHSYPHTKNWGLPDEHGVAFYDIGHQSGQPPSPMKRDYSACMNCHDKVKNPTSPATSCAGCHADMPHGQSFPGKTGTAKPISHGAYVGSHSEQLGSCYSCHFNPQRHGPKIDTCLNCHDEDSPLPSLPPKPEPTPTPAAPSPTPAPTPTN